MRGPSRLVLTLVRIALRAYPQDFRHSFGLDMEQAFSDGWLDTRSRGRVSTARFLFRTLVNTTAMGIAERVQPSRSSNDEPELGPPMDAILQDFRHTVRALRRRPGFTFIAVLTLALGVGANTAIFSVVHGVLLTPLPYEDADRLVTVWAANEADPDARGNMSSPDIEDLAASASFESLVAYAEDDFALTGLGEAEVVEGARAVGSLLQVFGLAPQLGRDIESGDAREGAASVVVVSNAFWQERFAADPDVLGRILELDGRRYEIVGVAPPGFNFPGSSNLWHSHELDPGCGRGCHIFASIGRLASGATLEQALQEANAKAQSLQETFPDSNHEKLFALVPLLDLVVGDVRTGLWVLLGAVGLVLLIACANVANLLLVRAQTRSGEVAVRAALGASGRRLAAQVMVESLVLSTAGGAAGLLLAWAGVEALRRMAPADLPRLDQVAVDSTVLLFTLALVVSVALLFGAVPAVRSARTSLASSLGSAGPRSGGHRDARTRSLLLAGEVALSLVLLVGAGLLLKSFERLMAVELGYEPQNVVRFSLFLPASRYPDLGEIGGFFDRLEERLLATPGVDAAGSTLGAPLGTTRVVANLQVAGRPEAGPGRKREARFNTATPGYFEAVGIPILRGRGILPSDRVDAVPVAVVSQRFVEQNFPGEEPLGQAVTMSVDFGHGKPTFTIVGVVPNVVSSSLTSEAHAAIYVPLAQMGPGFATVHVRAREGVAPVLPTLRRVVQDLDPDLPLRDVETMRDAVQGKLAPTRFYLTLIALFAGLALVLAAVGLYGVVAYLASRRTREIGVRIALGADRRSIAGLVLREGVQPALLGVSVGLLAAWAGARLLDNLLFQVAPTDPLIFAGVTALLLIVVVAATLLPARNAARLDPMEALRAE